MKTYFEYNMLNQLQKKKHCKYLSLVAMTTAVLE